MGEQAVGTAPALARLGLVGRALADAMSGLSSTEGGPAARPVRILDCGGGSGTFAVPLAAAGASVTVIDISADALATLARRAAEAGVAEQIVGVAGDVETLRLGVPDVGPAGFDLVLAHGILDAVDDVEAAFAGIAAAARPGGLVSILVGNPVAVVLARAMAGDLEGARSELVGLDEVAGAGRVPRAVGSRAVRALCERHALSVERSLGIGVFADLVPGAALDAPGARAALAELEAAGATRVPFADIAARVHLLARRSGDGSHGGGAHGGVAHGGP